MQGKELGSVAANAQRLATWSIKFSFLQEAMKLTKADGQTRRLISPTFGSGQWRALLIFDPDEPDHCGAFVFPAAKVTTPIKASLVAVMFHTSTGGDAHIALAISTPDIQFENNTDLCGHPRAIPVQVIESHDPSVELYGSMRIEEGVVPVPARIPRCLLMNPTYCDVAFTFPNISVPIFAFKPVLVQQSTHFADVFKSGFAEGTTNWALPHSLGKLYLEYTFIGDHEEFAEFEPQKDDESTQAATPASDILPVKNRLPYDAETQIAPSDAATSSTAAPAPDSAAQASTSTLDKPNSTVNGPGRLAALGETLSQKRYQRVEVSDCSWGTFRAYLHALYYDEVAWAKSRAHMLAVIYKDGATPTEGWQALRYTLLLAQAAQADTKGPPVCSPHAFYRLTDRYLDERQRDRARWAILQGLTVETAAYEAFSSLSRSFPNVRDGVIDWIVDHADDVFKSRGWQRALELVDEGALAGGATVMNRILTAVREKAAREAEAVAGPRGKKHYHDEDSE